MPAHFDDDDDWILVERRRGRREDRWQDRDRRNEDYRPARYYRSEYLSPENRQTERRREFFSRGGGEIRRNDYPYRERWQVRRNEYPSRERRDYYATMNRFDGSAERQNGRREYSGYYAGRTTFLDPRPRPPRPRQDGWMRRQEYREDRNPNRRRRYFNPPPRLQTRPQTERIQSDDPDFLQKVRVIHKVIKSVHHLNNVTQKDYPLSLRKMTHNLATFVKPAMPTKETQTLIEQNAKNWTETTVTILRDHYNLNLEEDVQILSQLSTDDWRPPFEIAASWARRNLGRRLTEGTLDQAQAVIVAKMADLRTTDEALQQPALRTRRERDTRTADESSRVLTGETIALQRTREGADSRGLNNRNLPDQRGTSGSTSEGPTRPRILTSNRRLVTADVHVPPPSLHTPLKTVATMTEPQTNKDWSAIFEEDNDDDSFHSDLNSEHPQETEQEPLEQRETRTSRAIMQRKGNSDREETTPTESFQPSSDPPLQITQSGSPLNEQNQRERDSTEVFSLRPLQREGDRSRGLATTSRINLTPMDISKLRSSVQTHLQVETAEEESSTPHSSPELQICTPTKHPNTPRKHQDWNLHIKEKSVIVGDSNVARMPTFAAKSVQIDSLPGAKWCHAETVLNKATIDVKVEKLVLSFGLCNRSQRDKRTPVTELKRALETAADLFPEARIFVPVLNFSAGLPHREQGILQHLNNFITGLENHIPALPQDQFSTERDHVHWTKNTAMNMLKHWSEYVN